MNLKWIVSIALVVVFLMASARLRARNRVPNEDTSSSRGAACQAFCYALEAKEEPQPAPTPSPDKPAKVSGRDLVSHVVQPVSYNDKQVANVTHAVFSRETGKPADTQVATQYQVAPKCKDGVCERQPRAQATPQLAPAPPPQPPLQVGPAPSVMKLSPQRRFFRGRVFRFFRWGSCCG